MIDAGSYFNNQQRGKIMNFKKIGIAAVSGFVAMAVASGIPLMLFYEPTLASLHEKFPTIVNAPPDMVPAMIGGIVWMFVMVIIFDKMGTIGIKDGALTGAWIGAAKWFFFNMQMLAMIPPIFPMDYIMIDVPLSALSYAAAGAAIGWALERF